MNRFKDYIQKWKEDFLQKDSHSERLDYLQVHRIAVHVHLYHFEFFEEIFKRIIMFPFGVDFYITISGEDNKKYYQFLSKHLNLKGFQIGFIENIGMDVYPFVDFLINTRNNNYDLILKLHTKKNNPRSGPAWREICLRNLIGSEDGIMNIISFLVCNVSVQLLGPALLYKSAKKFMYNNYEVVNDFTLETVGEELSDLTEWGFFAGTMFWARPSIFRTLISYLSETSISFESSVGLSSSDGTLAHACERIFGLLPRINNGKVATVEPTGECINEGVAFNLNPLPSIEPTTFTIERISGKR